MSLAPGTRFGVYEVGALIGEGGMGEVYLARDTALGRDVALKVLPDAFARDAERVARFKREAHLLATVNHAGIAHIYGLEEAAGSMALAMEFVEGPTLAQRIDAGPIAVDEALSIARQIALALESAHALGIVHRDLKPSNIKVRDDGTVKVLDFGLARNVEPPATAIGTASTPTITSPALTAQGVILGTAAYMAPEQARGHVVDKRADVWAFGCVVYEMLTGRRPFRAAEVADVLAAVIASEPDWTALPHLPPIVESFLRRCLAKRPSERVHDIADVRLALDGAFGGMTAATATAPAAPPWWRTALAVVAGVAVTSVIAGSLWPRPEIAVARFRTDLPEGRDLNQAFGQILAVAPDGRSFVYNTPEALYIQTLDELEARAIPGTQNASRPFYSPNGQWIGYFQQGQLKRTDTQGGATLVLADARNPQGVTWLDDGTVLYGQPDGVWKVPASGGTPQQILALGDAAFAAPQLLPDGDSMLLTVTDNPTWSTAQVVVHSIATGTRKTVVSDGRSARYLPTGHIVYGVGSALYAAPFDLRTLATTGPAVVVASGVLTSAGMAHYAVSPTGSLVYVSGQRRRGLVWLDRQGRQTPVDMPSGNYVYVRLSPDDRRAAVYDQVGSEGTWIWDFAAKTRTKLTVGGRGGSYPIWSGDGARVVFSGPGQISTKAADDTGTVNVLLNGFEAQPYFLYGEGGRSLVFRRSASIWKWQPGGEPAVLVDEAADEPQVSEFNPDLSPDGRWLAYQSNGSGRYEVYVRPFANIGSGRRQVSTSGGVMPRWSADGRELFYIQADQPLGAGVMMSAAVDPNAEVFTAGVPSKLVDWPWRSWVVMRTYDVSSDGRFLATAPSGDAERPRFVVVRQWFQELARLVQSAR